MSDIIVSAQLAGGNLEASASLGRIVEVPVGPDVYEGPYLVAPEAGDIVLLTGDKLLEDDITVKGTEPDWDHILYPIEGDPDGIFNAFHISAVRGSKLIIEFAGYGRVLSVYGKNEQWGDVTFPRVTYGNAGYYDGMNARRMRVEIPYVPFTTTGNYNLVFGANEWQAIGKHSTAVASQFRGEYIKVKVIQPDRGLMEE